MLIIDDIIWLDTIIEKLAWKHNVFTSEVEDMFGRPCLVFKKEAGRVEGEHLYNALGRTEAGKYLSVFLSENLGIKRYSLPHAT